MPLDRMYEEQSESRKRKDTLEGTKKGGSKRPLGKPRAGRGKLDFDRQGDMHALNLFSISRLINCLDCHTAYPGKRSIVGAVNSTLETGVNLA